MKTMRKLTGLLLLIAVCAGCGTNRARTDEAAAAQAARQAEIQKWANSSLDINYTLGHLRRKIHMESQGNQIMAQLLVDRTLLKQNPIEPSRYRDFMKKVEDFIDQKRSPSSELASSGSSVPTAVQPPAPSPAKAGTALSPNALASAATTTPNPVTGPATAAKTPTPPPASTSIATATATAKPRSSAAGAPPQNPVSPFANAAKPQQLLANSRSPAQAGLMEECRSPFTITLRAGTDIRTLNGCRSLGEGSFSHLVKDSEFLIYSQR